MIANRTSSPASRNARFYHAPTAQLTPHSSHLKADSRSLKAGNKNRPHQDYYLQMPKKTNFLGVGIALGAGLGVVFGSAMHNVAVGIAIGMALGVALGSAMNKRPDDSN